ncbi:hypothetical protein X975_06556, partial [Stegodyphus mimosarum]
MRILTLSVHALLTIQVFAIKGEQCKCNLPELQRCLLSFDFQLGMFFLVWVSHSLPSTKFFCVLLHPESYE